MGSKTTRPSRIDINFISGKGTAVQWHPIYIEPYHCRYCRHSLADHKGVVLTYAAGHRGRRSDYGLYQASCAACAEEKQTKQVICYGLPSRKAR